jgi:hypothetical protein
VATVPVQRTWVTGEVVTAAMFNDDLRDAVNFLTNVPRVHAYASTPTTPATGVLVVPPLNVERYDSDAMHSLVTNPDRVTIVTPGTYKITAGSKWGANNSGNRDLRLMLNGGQIKRSIKPSADTSDDTLTIDWACVAGDYLQLNIVQNSGGGLAMDVGGGVFLCAHWISV